MTMLRADSYFLPRRRDPLMFGKRDFLTGVAFQRAVHGAHGP